MADPFAVGFVGNGNVSSTMDDMAAAAWNYTQTVGTYYAARQTREAQLNEWLQQAKDQYGVDIWQQLVDEQAAASGAELVAPPLPATPQLEARLFALLDKRESTSAPVYQPAEQRYQAELKQRYEQAAQEFGSTWQRAGTGVAAAGLATLLAGSIAADPMQVPLLFAGGPELASAAGIGKAATALRALRRGALIGGATDAAVNAAYSGIEQAALNQKLDEVGAHVLTADPYEAAAFGLLVGGAVGATTAGFAMRKSWQIAARDAEAAARLAEIQARAAEFERRVPEARVADVTSTATPIRTAEEIRAEIARQAAIRDPMARIATWAEDSSLRQVPLSNIPLTSAHTEALPPVGNYAYDSLTKVELRDVVSQLQNNQDGPGPVIIKQDGSIWTLDPGTDHTDLWQAGLSPTENIRAVIAGDTANFEFYGPMTQAQKATVGRIQREAKTAFLETGTSATDLEALAVKSRGKVPLATPPATELQARTDNIAQMYNAMKDAAGEEAATTFLHEAVRAEQLLAAQRPAASAFASSADLPRMPINPAVDVPPLPTKPIQRIESQAVALRAAAEELDATDPEMAAALRHQADLHEATSDLAAVIKACVANPGYKESTGGE